MAAFARNGSKTKKNERKNNKSLPKQQQKKLMANNRIVVVGFSPTLRLCIKCLMLHNGWGH